MLNSPLTIRIHMQPFSKIRVIDLTHVIAGPFCAYQLAVMGADVIKIEPPKTPDMVRAKTNEFPYGDKGLAHFFVSQNANKRSLCLELTSEPGQNILKQLIASADVFIENYRSGALAKLGFGYEDVKAITPDIIYCSLTGFGQQGPLSERTAYDNVIQAYSGLMAANGNEQTSPTKVGPPILDYGTGIQAAFAISAALFQRTISGEGQYIDIAMLDAALMLMSSSISYYDQKNELIPLTGNNSSFNAGYSCYQTKQGLLMLGAYTGEQVKNMWLVLGDSDHAQALKNHQPPGMSAHLVTDSVRISKLLLEKTAAEWEIIFNAQKVPAARVRTLDEALNDGQLKYRDVIQTSDSDTGKYRTPLAAFKFVKNGPKLKRSPPIFGQHTHEILQELGYSNKEIHQLASKGTISLAESESNSGTVRVDPSS